MELPRAYYRYKRMELFTAWLITVETELHTNRHAWAPSTLLRVQVALSRSFLWWINTLWTINTSVCNVKTAERKPREGGSILPLELEEGDILFRGLWSTEASVGAQVNRGDEEGRLRWVQVTSPNGTYPYTSEIIALMLLQWKNKQTTRLTCQHVVWLMNEAG